MFSLRKSQAGAAMPLALAMLCTLLILSWELSRDTLNRVDSVKLIERQREQSEVLDYYLSILKSQDSVTETRRLNPELKQYLASGTASSPEKPLTIYSSAGSEIVNGTNGL